MNTEFHETQRFSLWLTIPVLLIMCGIPLWGVYEQVIAGRPLGDDPMSDTALIIVSLLTVSLGLFVAMMKLSTDIDRKGIRMRFYPLVRTSISWEEIRHAEVINYGFVGGWGIRIWTKHGTVYNTKGKIGLKLVLKSGKKMVIGTQKEEALKEVVAQYFTPEAS